MTVSQTYDPTKIDGIISRLKERITGKTYRKLDALFTAALKHLERNAPVNTGNYLASFRVRLSNGGVNNGPVEVKGDGTPVASWQSGKLDSSVQSRLREKAKAILWAAYEEDKARIFSNLWRSPNKKVYLTNGSPQSAILEYGGGDDWTKGAYRGLIQTAWIKAQNEIKNLK